MHDYTHIYIYIQKKNFYKNPFTFDNRSVSEWSISGNSGYNITHTKTDERGMDMTYQVTLYLFVF